MKPSPRDVRWLVDGLNDTKRRLKALENRKPGLAYSSIEDGAIREFDKDGVQGSQVGKQPDGTHGSVTLNGPKPPKPTDPIVTSNPGQGEARWNGKFANGVVSPLDLKHVAAYFVLAGEFLDLSKQAGVMTGELGDNVQAQLEPGVYSVYLVSWSQAGRYSDAAGPVMMIVPAAADTDWIQGALDDLDEKYDGVITEAGTLGDRLTQAETDLSLAGDLLADTDQRLDEVFGEVAAIPSAIDSAKQAAINAAASDAQTKVDAASALANAQIAQIIAKGQNLVRNGDFEDGTGLLIDGWNLGAGAVATTSNPRSGLRCLGISAPTANTWPTSEWVPSSTGRTYYVEYWVRVGGAPELTAETGFVVQVKTALGGTASHTVGRVANGDITRYTYVKRSVTFTVPTADVVAVRFAAWVNGPTTTSYNIDSFLAVDVTEAKAAIDAAEVARLAAVAAQAAAGTAQSTANNALTMAGSKARVYYSTSAPSGTATDRDVWRQINAVKDVIGEWFWDATLSTPGWVKTLISSQSISNLDVGKLTVGTGIITDLVAEHIAGRSARFLQLDVSQLVAVTGTIGEAVINRLYSDVVMSRKGTFGMLAIGSFDNAVVDPDFTDTALTAARFAASSASVVGPIATDADGRNYVPLPVNAGSAAFKMFADPASRPLPVVPGATYRIRFQARVASGTAGARATATIYRSDGTSSYIAVSPSSYVALTTTWQWCEYQYTMPDNATGAFFDVQRQAGGTGIVHMKTPAVTRMNAGELVLDGSMKAKHIDVDDLVADTGYITKLVAKIVKADMFVGKEFIGGIFTGATFQTSVLPNVGLKLTDTGLRAYPSEGGGPIVEILTEGATTLGIVDPLTGEQLATLGDDGSISGQTLSVADQARVDGALVSGGDPLVEIALGGTEPGKYGPVHNGRALFGTNFTNRVEEDPATTDYTSWMEMVPYGAGSNGWIQSTASWGWNGTGGQPHYRVVMAVTAELVSGRGYLLNFRAPPFKQTTTAGALDSSVDVGAAFVRYSAPGSGIGANNDGSILPGTLQYIPGGGSSFAPQGTTYIRCPEDVPAGKIMFGIEAYCYAGRSMITPTTQAANRWEIVVSDVGPRRALNDSVPASSSQQGTDPKPAPIPPAPARPKLQTQTFDYIWYGSYNADNTPYDYAKLNTKVVQGLGPGASGGVKKGMIAFPSLQPTLSGATVKKIEVYLYTEHWYSSAGGLLGIGTHSSAATSKPGAFVSTSLNITSAKTQKPEGRWVTLPASTHAGFQAGTLRGIVLRPASNSSAVVHYGFVNPSQKDKKARIRVSYLK